MNKKMFQSTVRSLAHYNKEIADLKQSLKVTEQIREDLLKGCNQFVELQPDDVFFINGNVRKFKTIVRIEEEGTGGVTFVLDCIVPDKHGWESDSRRTTHEYLTFEQLENLKILNR